MPVYLMEQIHFSLKMKMEAVTNGMLSANFVFFDIKKI